ncbi:MAG: Asp-tRNA(Asn)/Glu-tRNA(Gln) amidotransferase subunit GatB [Candidatus Omnitrophota bacterium]|nr:MAG: Asp-tRNA(Asn)/Glu-tRNA(Gln) amidotransferase subunit GatB [Candidatus Omnitrophota bacterium]
MSKLETVIGLEVHVQLKTKSKIFCSCSTAFQSGPNINICPVCCGYPGVLPVFNQKALELATRVCLALHCKINKKIYFERKNYFYPDLPKGYQISQYKMPLAEAGFLEIPSGKKIPINRVHLEEDAGKSVHKEKYSLVDFNRTGIPLLEIVSEPQINTPEEALDYLAYLKLTLQYIGASDCDMEKGLLRCDANISLREEGKRELGTKVELKNMNTFKGVRDALGYEARRQESVFKKGDRLFQETRLWDADKARTSVMRTKEEAHDYRYFPEPDLLDFFVPQELIDRQAKFVGERPLEKRVRFIEKYQLPEREVDVIISNIWLADFFEEAVKVYSEPKEISNWLLGPFLEQLNNLAGDVGRIKISPANFSKIVKYFSQGKLNNITAKRVLCAVIATDEDIDKVIEDQGLHQVSDQEQLSGIVEEVISSNPKPVNDYLEGKQSAIMFLVGQVMKKTKGKANPKVVREILEGRLKK